MGTLPEDFPTYRLTHIPIERNRNVCRMPWGTEIELKPFFGIMGVAPPPAWGQCSSVDDAAKEALRDMIRLIRGKTGISAEDAYMLCSLAADLHVTQTVDGNKGVHCMIKKELIGG
jgi:acetamidase/formamidase